MKRLALALLISSSYAFAADPLTPDQADQISRAEKNIPVAKAPHDAEIANRLKRILTVTGWFKDLKVDCREGVVSLHGEVLKPAHSQWAEALARDTDEVVAVINDIEIQSGRWLDLTPAEKETENLAKRTMAFLPYLVTSIIVFALFTLLATLVSKVSRRAAAARMSNVLMIELVARVSSLPVLLIGMYLVLRVCGLTGIAVTVLGGTGALGLVAGFAMQNILANYFAGIMLSIRNPYTMGDVITVAGQTGVVQKLTTRGTILVDFDGNHIIIPNSTIYNNIIVNQSSNPKSRVKFTIGISYNDTVSKARTLILEILNSSKGVLREPEPLVLVSDFQAGSVLISSFFWITSAETSGDKLKSLIMEKVKFTLHEHGYTLPGFLQPIGFAAGIPEVGKLPTPMRDIEAKAHSEPTEIHSEKQELLREASKGRDLDHGRDLKMPKT